MIENLLGEGREVEEKKETLIYYKAELERREAVLIGDESNGLRVRRVNNTQVFLAQFSNGQETAIGRRKIEDGNISPESVPSDETKVKVLIYGGELIEGGKREFIIGVPKGLSVAKLHPKASKS